MKHHTVGDKQGSEHWAMARRWVKVASSNVLAMHYDPDEKILSVQFKGEAKGVKFPIYKYKGVPIGVARAFYTAGSKGKMLWRNIRDKYDVEGPM